MKINLLKPDEDVSSFSATLLLGGLQFICLALLTVGITEGLFSILYSTDVPSSYIFKLCVSFCFFFTLVFHLKRGIYITLASIGLFCFYVFKNAAFFLLGGKNFCNLIIERINPYYYINIEPFSVISSSKESLSYIALGIVFVLALLFSYCLVFRGRNLFITCVTIGLLLSGLLIGRLPEQKPLFLCILTLFFLAGLKKRKPQISIVCCLSLGFLTLVSLVLSCKISPVYSSNLFSYHTSLIEAEKKVENSISSGSWYYDVFLSGSFSFLSASSGALNNYQPKFINIDVLEVTSSLPVSKKLYLKNWVGGAYQNNIWKPISEENFWSAANTWKIKVPTTLDRSIQDLGFHHFESIDPNVLNFSDTQKSDLFVTTLRKSNKKIYFPYYCKLPRSVVPVADGYIQDKMSSSGELPVSSASTIRFTGYPFETGYFKYSLLSSSKSDEIPSYIRTTNQELEDAYRKYVYEEYTQVPKEGLERLKEICSSKYNNLGNNKDALIDFVTSFLSDSAVYSTNLESLPSNADFVEDFLFRQKKGFCTHFATSATLMFRMFGIPARYVSGYMVSPSAFQPNGDDKNTFTAIIKDNRSHAWTEIYLDEVGWVPIETTPGYTGLKRSSSDYFPDSTSPPSPTVKPQPLHTSVLPSSTPSPTIVSPVESAKFGTTLTIGLKYILYIFLFLFLSIGILWIRYLKIHSTREKNFYQKDTSKAVIAVSQQIYHLLIKVYHFKNNFVDDDEYTLYAQEHILCLAPKDFLTFVTISRKATFSQATVTEEELSFCRHLYMQLISDKMKFLNHLQRLYLKYILVF